MNSIPQQRLLVYLLLLGATPLLFVLFSCFSEYTAYTALKTEIESASSLLGLQNAKELHNTIVRTTYQNKDLFYIHKELEHMMPLQKEIDKLQKHTGGQLNFEEETIKKRLRFLTTENKFSFVEGVEKKMNGVREIELSLSRPVEIDLVDLKNLLSKLEGVPMSGEEIPETRPHVIIKEFRLDKKEGFFSETYLVHLKLIQRDYPKM